MSSSILLAALIPNRILSSRYFALVLKKNWKRRCSWMNAQERDVGRINTRSTTVIKANGRLAVVLAKFSWSHLLVLLSWVLFTLHICTNNFPCLFIGVAYTRFVAVQAHGSFKDDQCWSLTSRCDAFSGSVIRMIYVKTRFILSFTRMCSVDQSTC